MMDLTGNYNSLISLSDWVDHQSYLKNEGVRVFKWYDCPNCGTGFRRPGTSRKNCPSCGYTRTVFRDKELI